MTLHGFLNPSSPMSLFNINIYARPKLKFVEKRLAAPIDNQ